MVLAFFSQRKSSATSESPGVRRQGDLLSVYILGSLLAVGARLMLEAKALELPVEILFGILLVSTFSVPLIYQRTRNYRLAAYQILISLSFLLFLFFYLRSDVATGLFWFCLIPIVGALLLAREGVLVGTAFFVVGIGLFRYFHGSVPFDELIFSLLVIGILSRFAAGEKKAYKKLSQRKNEVENLLRLVLHDIANPLLILQMVNNRIRRAQEIIEVEKSTERLERVLLNMHTTLERIRAMITTVEGKRPLCQIRADLGQLLNEAVEQHLERLDIKNIKIKTKAPELPLVIVTDPVILKNVVLSNLISNAIKFTPRNSEIKVSLSFERGHAIVEVQDCGIGIPDAMMVHIFSFNHPTNRQGTEGETGTGYGLPLVREYLMKMNGDIQIFSKEGHGTTVRVALPIRGES